MQKKRITSRTQVTKMSVSKYEQARLQFTYLICREFDAQQSKEIQDSSGNLGASKPQQSLNKRDYMFNVWMDHELRKAGLSLTWPTALKARIVTLYCARCITDHLCIHVQLKVFQSTKPYFFLSNSPVTDDKSRLENFRLALKTKEPQSGAHIPKAGKTAQQANEYIFGRVYMDSDVKERIAYATAAVLAKAPEEDQQAYIQIATWKITFYQTLNHVGELFTHTIVKTATYAVIIILSFTLFGFTDIVLDALNPFSETSKSSTRMLPHWLKSHVQPIRKKITPLSLLAIGVGVISICAAGYRYPNCKKVIDFFLKFLSYFVDHEARIGLMGSAITTATDAQSRLGAFISQTSSHSVNGLFTDNRKTALKIWLSVTNEFEEFSSLLEPI